MSHPRDVYHFLTQTISQYAERVLFTCIRDKKLYDITYGTFFEDVKKAARSLQEILGEEKRIAIAGENSYEWMVYCWGTMLLGKSVVMIDPEMHPEEMARRLALFRIRYVCIGAEDTPLDHVESVPMEIPQGPGLDLTGYDLLNREKTEAAVRFSTGTTGDFKAIYLCQRSLVTGFDPFSLKDVESVFIPLPFYHVMAQTYVVSAMVRGCRCCIGSGNKYVLKDLQSFEPEMIIVTPVYLNLFAQRLERRGTDPGSVRKLFGGNLKRMLTGGASPQKRVLEILTKTGIGIYSGYGASETSIIASGEIGGEDRCLGDPVSYLEVKILEDEILVKSPSLFLGYAEGEDVSDDWYATGDLGYLDEQGRLFLTGRKKNLIILSNGKNVSPEHLEAELFTVSGITEALVYEEDDRICAEIYAENAGEEALQEIRSNIQVLNAKKPTYYQIQKVTFREEPFDHVGIGKIRRNRH